MRITNIIRNSNMIASELWFNIEYGALIFAFVHAIIYPNTTATNLILAYGGVVHLPRICYMAIKEKKNVYNTSTVPK